MKIVNVTTGILVMTVVVLTATSCKDAKKVDSSNESETTDMHNNASHGHSINHEDAHSEDNKMKGMNQHVTMSSQIIVDYLDLKNALVADNKNKAAKAGEKLVGSLGDFDEGKFNEERQKELMDIIEDATEHAEHIAKSPIDHQREHFDVLSKDVIDLIAITGTDKTLYQDFCPMYNNKKGAQWLSESKEIKNPFYGSKMLTCGSVQKQIN